MRESTLRILEAAHQLKGRDTGKVVNNKLIETENKSVTFSDPMGAPAQPIKTINVKYGVENYFVPEGEGRVLETPKPGETVSIRLVVDRNGNAAIKAVLVNGVERLF